MIVSISSLNAHACLELSADFADREVPLQQSGALMGQQLKLNLSGHAHPLRHNAIAIKPPHAVVLPGVRAHAEPVQGLPARVPE